MWQCGSSGLRGGCRDCRDHRAGLDGLTFSFYLFPYSEIGYISVFILEGFLQTNNVLQLQFLHDSNFDSYAAH